MKSTLLALALSELDRGLLFVAIGAVILYLYSLCAWEFSVGIGKSGNDIVD